MWISISIESARYRGFFAAVLLRTRSPSLVAPLRLPFFNRSRWLEMKKKFPMAVLLLAAVAAAIGLGAPKESVAQQGPWDCFTIVDKPCGCQSCWINNCNCPVDAPAPPP